MRGVWLHTFLQMYASGGAHTPLTKSGQNSPYCIGVSEDYRKMAMTKVYSTGGWIPWGCLIILTKNVWNLWGGTLLKTMKNVCKQGCADLWLQNIQSASHSRNIFSEWLRTVTVRALNIEEGYALTCCKHTHHRYDDDGGNRSRVNHFTRASPRQPTRQLKMYERDSVWNLSIFLVGQLSGDSLGNPWGLTKHKYKGKAPMISYKCMHSGGVTKKS